MILCPNCHHQEISGALFCSECGAQLVLIEHIDTQLFGKKASGSETALPDSNPLQGKKNPLEGLGISISLYLVDSGQILHLTDRAEYSLGRTTEGQPILPDVDFSPYDAYTQGVSRLHATLKVNEQKIIITDLGSSNGTRVNGQKIMPHIDYPVNHGDVVSLGKLKIQILVRMVDGKG